LCDAQLVVDSMPDAECTSPEGGPGAETTNPSFLKLKNWHTQNIEIDRLHTEVILTVSAIIVYVMIQEER
jgi:hypothetical protein